GNGRSDRLRPESLCRYRRAGAGHLGTPPLHRLTPEVVLERSDPPRVKVTLDRGPVSPRQP
ncbi:MAG: hypothetical protein P9M08_03140, partial [Candidatus Erginobacter occultus]|nr:hypothetical protein [Candidatus Erginobacter occultus]